MEVILPCFNLKPDDCNQATTILLLKRSQLHQTLTLGKLGIFLNKILLILNKTHPGSISDFNIIEKNLMWLAEFIKKTINGLSSKISIKDVFLKKFMSEKQLNPVSFDVTRTSIYFQKFNECLYDWSILNHWPIQKIDLLTPKSIEVFSKSPNT